MADIDELMKYIEQNNESMVQAIHAGVKIRPQHLAMACRVGNVRTCKLLMPYTELTPEVMASAIISHHTSIVHLLLKTHPQFAYDPQHIRLACQYEYIDIVIALLGYDADANAAVLDAIHLGNIELIRILFYHSQHQVSSEAVLLTWPLDPQLTIQMIQRGIDLHPLHRMPLAQFAAMDKRLEQALLPYGITQEYYRIFLRAIRTGQCELVESLVDRVDVRQEEDHAFRLAIERNALDLVEKLIRLGVDVNIHGGYPLSMMIVHQNKNGIELLLRSGAMVTSSTLIAAVETGNLDIVQLFGTKSSFYEPIIVTISTGQVRIFEYLIKNSALTLEQYECVVDNIVNQPHASQFLIRCDLSNIAITTHHVNTLLASGDMDAFEFFDRTGSYYEYDADSLLASIRGDNVDLVRRVLSHGHRDDTDYILHASKNVVELLLDAKIVPTTDAYVTMIRKNDVRKFQLCWERFPILPTYIIEVAVQTNRIEIVEIILESIWNNHMNLNRAQILKKASLPMKILLTPWIKIQGTPDLIQRGLWQDEWDQRERANYIQNLTEIFAPSVQDVIRNLIVTY